MLVIILAGYVFLFLQGKILRASLDDLRARLDRGEEAAQRRSTTQVETVSALRESIPVIQDDSEAWSRIFDAVDAQNRGLDALIERMNRLDEERADAVMAAPPHMPSLQSETAPAKVVYPEAVALEFLVREGFGNVQIMGERPTEDGLKLLVTAHYGDQLRQGHVTVSDGRVTDVSLKIPTSFFP
jgi:hypothetical protein